MYCVTIARTTEKYLFFIFIELLRVFFFVNTHNKNYIKNNFKQLSQLDIF